MDNEKYPLALSEGTILAGQYIIQKVLGQGGFGITYMAVDHKSGQKVAVKEFFPDTLATRTQNMVTSYEGERTDSFNYGKTCFLQEAETLAAFIGNENIVRIHSYFEENSTAYFVMDFVEGISFDEYIRQNGGKVSYEDAERVLLPVIDALALVHSRGIVHRDVTPDNIFITKDGTVKLLDFGAARYSLGDKSRSLDVVLKHGFAPKEQYTRHGRQGPFTDVYTVGASFYFAITGKRPPDSIDRLEEDDLVPPSSLGVKLDSKKEEAILKAMSVQPGDRFQNMEAFKRALVPDEEAAPTVASQGATNQRIFTAPQPTATQGVQEPQQSVTQMLTDPQQTITQDTQQPEQTQQTHVIDKKKKVTDILKRQSKVSADLSKAPTKKKRMVIGAGIAVVLVVLLVMIFSGGHEEVLGNTPDNIANLGFIASDGENIFWKTGHSIKCSDGTEYGDGIDPLSISCIGKYIYYIDGKDTYVYRIDRTDGSKEFVYGQSGDVLYSAYILSSYSFFYNGTAQRLSCWKNGKQTVDQLVDLIDLSYSNWVTFIGEYIYYVDSEASGIYRMPIKDWDMSSREVVIEFDDLEWDGIIGVNTDGEYLYAVVYSDDNSALFDCAQINPSTGKIIKTLGMETDICYSVNACDECVYYSTSIAQADGSEKYHVYKIDFSKINASSLGNIEDLCESYSLLGYINTIKLSDGSVKVGVLSYDNGENNDPTFLHYMNADGTNIESIELQY